MEVDDQYDIELIDEQALLEDIDPEDPNFFLYNIGALASGGVGFIFPEELSIFSPSEKQAIIQHKRISNNIVYIQSIRTDGLLEIPSPIYFTVNTIAFDGEKDSGKTELYKSKRSRGFWKFSPPLELYISREQLMCFEFFAFRGYDEFVGRLDLFPYMIDYFKSLRDQSEITLKCDNPVNHMFFDAEYFTKSPHVGLKWRNRKDIKGTITVELKSEIINVVSHKWAQKPKLARTQASPQLKNLRSANNSLNRSAPSVHPAVSPTKLSLSLDVPYFKRDNSVTAFTQRDLPSNFVLPSEENIERIISYNVGALVSNGAGWMFPEQLSVFPKSAKENIMEIKKMEYNYEVEIFDLEAINPGSSSKMTLCFVLSSITLDISKFINKKMLWRQSAVSKTSRLVYCSSTTKTPLKFQFSAGEMISLELWSSSSEEKGDFIGRLDLFPYLIYYYKTQFPDNPNIILRTDQLINHFLIPKKSTKHLKVSPILLYLRLNAKPLNL